MEVLEEVKLPLWKHCMRQKLRAAKCNIEDKLTKWQNESNKLKTVVPQLIKHKKYLVNPDG